MTKNTTLLFGPGQEHNSHFLQRNESGMASNVFSHNPRQGPNHATYITHPAPERPQDHFDLHAIVEELLQVEFLPGVAQLVQVDLSTEGYSTLGK